jgi:hypothetical protein
MLFKPTYLYIKTHCVTGLKYFGKTTSKDPYTYMGSGKYWLRHLSSHGKNISTEIVGHFNNRQECIQAATEFSKTHNIVESEEWANFKNENGLDGGSDVGHKKSNTAGMKAAASIKARKQLQDGTHPFMGKEGSKLAKKRNEKLTSEGKHNFQGERGSKHSTELNLKRVNNGTHNLTKRLDGTSQATDRVNAGIHNWLDNQGTVSVVDKLGNSIRIPKDIFWAQTGPKEDWEYVGISSKVAQKRLTDNKK